MSWLVYAIVDYKSSGEIVIIFLFLTLCFFASQCMDVEHSNISKDITLKFANNFVSTESRAIILMFPFFKDMIYEIDSPNDIIEMSYISSNIFEKWISFARDIKVEQEDKQFNFPSELPIPLIKKIGLFIKNHVPVHACAEFINAGDFLRVPNTIMQVVCNLIFKNILNTGNFVNAFSINNTAVQAYCVDLLELIKDNMMLHNDLLKIENTINLNLTNHSINSSYFFSRTGDYTAYFHKIVRTNRYYIYFINMKTKEVKGAIQQHFFDAQAKNNKLFIAGAATVPCFFTVHPEDDRLLVHYIDNYEMNHHINLNLGEKKELTCGTMSANAEYVIIGYDAHGEETLNKYLVYDQKGISSHAIFVQNPLISPRLCIGHPKDSSSGIFAAGHSNNQYFPTVVNNLIKMPLAHHENFLENANLDDVFYSDSGEYVFAIKTGTSNEKIKVFRLRSLNISHIYNEHSIPVLYNDDIRISFFNQNAQGDMAACVLSSGSGETHTHKLFLINYIKDRVDQISGDISSFAFDGYLLAYLEERQGKFIVIYDVLHQKELIRHQTSQDHLSILGFTKRHELVIKTRSGVSFYDILRKECWEQIERSIVEFKFLQAESNWFQDLLLLYKAIETSIITATSIQDWLKDVRKHFSQDFQEILIKCGLIKASRAEALKIAAELGSRIKQKRDKAQKIESNHEKQKLFQIQKWIAKQKQDELSQQKDATPVNTAMSVVPIGLDQPSQQIVQQPSVSQSTPPTLLQQFITGVQNTLSAIGSFIMAPLRWLRSWF